VIVIKVGQPVVVAQHSVGSSGACGCYNCMVWELSSVAVDSVLSKDDSVNFQFSGDILW